MLVRLKPFLEDLVRVRKAKRIKLEMDKLRESIKRIEGNLSAEFIREDRNVR